MTYRFQYTNNEERKSILEVNKDKYLIEEQNYFEGNFLVYSDVPPVKEIVYVNVPQEKLEKINENTDYLLDVDYRLLKIELGI